MRTRGDRDLRSNRRARLAYSAVAAALACPSLPATAAVLLGLAENDASPTAGAVAPGGSVDLTVSLTSTGQQTTGLDYQVRAPAAAASGHLRLTQRTPGASPFADTFFTNAEVTTQPGSLLDPSNDLDLGATLDNPRAPLDAGTFLVANLRLAVNATTPLGIYTIETFSQSGLGYTGTGPLFSDHEFDAHGSYQLVVRTLDGDANLDGAVGAEDFNLLASHFGLTGQSWSSGDFDFDGTVGAPDFNLLATNFGKTTAGGGAGLTSADVVAFNAFAASVPEPAAAATLVALLPLTILANRRRRSVVLPLATHH